MGWLVERRRCRDVSLPLLFAPTPIEPSAGPPPPTQFGDRPSSETFKNPYLKVVRVIPHCLFRAKIASKQTSLAGRISDCDNDGQPGRLD